MKQIEMDFARADQLGFLDKSKIDKTLVGKVNVSGKLAKAVLRCIDSHGRGRDEQAYCSIETIAMETGYSEKSIDRAIAALESRSLLIVNRDYRVNHYTIVWTELSMLCEVKNDTKKSGPIRDMVSTTRDMVSTTRDMVSSKRDMVTHKAYLNAKEPPPTAPVESAAAADVLKFDRTPETVSDVPTTETRIELESAFQSIGVERFAQMARRFAGRGPDVMRAIEVYNAQRSRFRGPGAVIDYLDSGAWPVDGVLTLEQLAGKQICRAQRNRARSREIARIDLCREWQRLGRWETATTIEIESELDRRLGTATLEAAS